MISIVIPTYNRKESLIRLLNSISNQSLAPSEIIVVASGYKESELEDLEKQNANIKIIHSSPSVCKQRNIGISQAKSEYVLLCDDDIELEKNYLSSLLDYSQKHKEIDIITGRELQQTEDNNWAEVQFPPTFWNLLYSYIFGLGICCDLTKSQGKNFISNRLFKHLKKKNNGISKGGWPMLTTFSFPVMQTTIYGLGCAMIKTEILQNNLYNEELGPNGIGDNYEVALKINGLSKKIHVLRDVNYMHHKEKSNRHKAHISYLKRCLSLHKFLKELPCFNWKNRLFFTWSIIGNGTRFLLKGDFNHFISNQKVLRVAFFNLFRS